MEERPVPPPPGRAKNDPPLLGAEPQETYVVQVPRDQVYRVPPPENARIVEQHTRNAPNKNKTNNSCAGPLCWTITTIVVISILLLACIFTIRATLYRPRYPLFKVAQIKAKNLNHIFARSSIYPPEYEIALRVKNPNPRLSATYRGPGKAALVFENHRIGAGGIRPATIKEEGDRPVNMRVSLSGKGVPLSPAMKLSVIQRGEKDMQLNMNVTMEVNSWLMNRAMQVTVTCDFKVTKSLLNSTVITSQDCDALF